MKEEEIPRKSKSSQINRENRTEKVRVGTVVFKYQQLRVI